MALEIYTCIAIRVSLSTNVADPDQQAWSNVRFSISITRSCWFAQPGTRMWWPLLAGFTTTTSTPAGDAGVSALMTPTIDAHIHI